MSSRILRLGTRRSPLALRQAEEVAAVLRRSFGPVEVVPVVTAGDRLQQAPPGPISGRGVFVGDLEQALGAGLIDIGVHSAKDVPPDLAPGLGLVAFGRRADPRDALVAPGAGTLATLPPGATVGTGSPRRACQLRRLRADLRVVAVRGNVETRLARAGGDLDAVVLAMAGLVRLDRAGAVTEIFAPEALVPAAGQGALAIEARLDDPEVAAAVALVNDPATALAVLAERAVLAGLGGGCSAPAGVYASAGATGRWQLRAIVCGPVSGRYATAFVEAAAEAPVAAEPAAAAAWAEALAERAVAALVAEGARALLAEGDLEDGR